LHPLSISLYLGHPVPPWQPGRGAPPPYNPLPRLTAWKGLIYDYYLQKSRYAYNVVLVKNIKIYLTI